MIEFRKTTLANGLKVIVHEDVSTPLVAMNILYNVGSRDESPDQTGFAHLFEHLMFGGSQNIPQFDEPLQNASGENNAFTSTDITNYYETLPAQNIETAFWLESDRMNQLAFSEHSLEVQRKVVVEEFKEHYINQPYGDAWHKLRELAFKVHPYQWPTIGKVPEHIEHAQLKDVKNFFFRFYRPNNAIVVVSGNVKTENAFRLTEKWFADIPSGNSLQKNIAGEPEQKEARSLVVEADVPLDAIYKAWHMPGRTEDSYYACDLISDILSGGKSGRLYHSLVKEKKLFSEINCYQTSTIDPGLMVVEGKLIKGVKMEAAEAAINEEIVNICSQKATETELEKVKNRIESQLVFSEMEALHKAMTLAYCELLGDANFANEEIKKYLSVTVGELQRIAEKIFRPVNCSTLYYRSKD